MIYHSVFLQFKSDLSQEQRDLFFSEAKKLAEIPWVQSLECLREISPKNSYEFGLIMQFETDALYEAYTHHPDHVRFVENIWIPSVANFQEIDYTVIL
ncbi:Dabb family protein [Cytophagaceae bacterium 50C-KIRBA]|uniref:Dabb family protein n=1 Tax=Aquirufa beregesia TaxID=2516556 RepID=A0ABX0EUI8_9BACT|nr:Dabb family protein [Aquirufa beregesia]NGZ43748.1 Dabb family protein [Aquirufa beregesia]